MLEFFHKPIMLPECMESLRIKPDGVYVDGTLGGGGHSREICKRLSDHGTLVGIDQDRSAILAATTVLGACSEKSILVKGSFFDIEHILSALDIGCVDGFLLDLGVSSHQLDEPSRGFSYMHDAPLDMRMDTTKPFSAADVVNKYSESKLTEIISNYGEERWAKRIAAFIVAERQLKPIATTFELVGVIKKAVPKQARQDGPHPAKRTFQAVRIEVNGELDRLSESLKRMAGLLNPGGRLCVITFHSLEDRIVKTVFKELETPCTCPPDFPVCACGKLPVVKIVTRKPIVPPPEEIETNPRARSAKLRVAEKL